MDKLKAMEFSLVLADFLTRATGKMIAATAMAFKLPPMAKHIGANLSAGCEMDMVFTNGQTGQFMRGTSN